MNSWYQPCLNQHQTNRHAQPIVCAVIRILIHCSLRPTIDIKFGSTAAREFASGGEEYGALGSAYRVFGPHPGDSGEVALQKKMGYCTYRLKVRWRFYPENHGFF